MEDKRIKDLFSNFQPELSSSFQFMESLQNKMEAVETLKQYTATLRRRNRLAVIAAALGGFASGVIVTLMMPLIVGWLSSLNISMPDLQISGMHFDYTIFGWLFTAATSLLTSLTIYDLITGMRRAPAP